MITVLSLDDYFPPSELNIDEEFLELTINEIEFTTLWSRNKPETAEKDFNSYDL